MISRFNNSLRANYSIIILLSLRDDTCKGDYDMTLASVVSHLVQQNIAYE